MKVDDQGADYIVYFDCLDPGDVFTLKDRTYIAIEPIKIKTGGVAEAISLTDGQHLESVDHDIEVLYHPEARICL